MHTKGDSESMREKWYREERRTNRIIVGLGVVFTILVGCALFTALLLGVGLITGTQ